MSDLQSLTSNNATVPPAAQSQTTSSSTTQSTKRRASLPTSRTAFSSYQQHNVEEVVFQRSSSNLLAGLTLFITKTYKTCDPKFKPIQTLPQRVLTVPSEPILNNGKDNQDANLICRVHDKLGSGDRSFTILDLLGTGTFGQVFRCKKDDTKELVAVKVIKNKPAYHNQGKLEIKIAQLLNTQYDPHNDKHIVRLLDYFEHHGHICLVFELLNMSLLDLLTQNQFRGLPLSLVQKYTKQILTALSVLEDATIIHCDLKPENILLQPFNQPKQKRVSSKGVTSTGSEKNSADDGTSSTPQSQVQSSQQESSHGSSRRSTAQMSDVKVIDFGSACFEGRTIYSYIQSRFYRSPEVLLGCPYTGAIDMWSLACVCAEMYLGLPLFPGVSQHNQLSRIVEMFGNPPDFLIECKNGSKYFTPVVPPDTNLTQNATGTKPPFLNAPSSTKYRIKTPEEYAAETKTEVPVLKKYLKYNVLDEVILKCFPAHKLRLTTEQKNIEIHRRKCFVDFLYGLFRLNPFERWSAKQAMEHPFIKNTPFTAPFVPPQDPKLQDRKLAFMLQLQQRSSGAATSSSSAASVPLMGMAGVSTNTDPNTGGNIQGQRVPTNFGSSVGTVQSTLPPLQSPQQKISDSMADSVATVQTGDPAVPNPLAISTVTNNQTSLPAESSPLSPPKNMFDSDERPMLKRGAPVHLKSASATAITPSESTISSTEGSVPSNPPSSDDTTSPQLSAALMTAAGIVDSKAPRPTGNIGRGQKPRHSFTTRVEQHMLKPQEILSNPGQSSTSALMTQTPNQYQSTLVNHLGQAPVSNSGIGSMISNQYMSQSLHAPSELGQYIHDNRKQAFQQQAQHQQLFSQQSNQNNAPSHQHHHMASSWNPFSSTASPINQNQKSGISALYSNQSTASHQPPQQQQPPQSWHQSHMMSNNQQSGQLAASAPFFNPSSNNMPTMSYNLQQQQHFLPPPPGPEFYVGSIGGHLSSSYGGSLGVFAAGSMQEGGHAMTDFGMALLRPDMDEQRRLLSQQSVNSSSGYWPGHISSYMPFNSEQPSHMYPNSSQQYGYSGTQSMNMAMSYDSTTFLQHQQQMQQQQQQQNMFARQAPSMNYPPIQIRKDALASLSPRTSRKSEIPTIGTMRMRSHSQDSTSGEVSPRGAPTNQISPSSKSATPTRFFGNNSGNQVAESPVTSEPVSPIKDANEDSSKVSPSKPKSKSSSKKVGRGGDSSTGKVADSMAEWDPFFESDDF